MTAVVAVAQHMQGSVLFVAPHRVLIPDGEATAVLSVANNSDVPRRYDLTMVDQVMGENGITERKDTFEYSLKRMVKFVPRRFSLKPNEKQAVRVMVRRPRDLADGDYHSHLLFREVPLSVKDKRDLQKERKETEKKATFEIRTLYGVAVPIVVQQGKIESDVSLGDVVLGKSEKHADLKQLNVSFNRTGNAEAVGYLSAQYEKAGQEAVPIVEGQWVRLYREVDLVKKSFVLSNLPPNAQGGKIVVTFVRDENDDSKTQVKDVRLP